MHLEVLDLNTLRKMPHNAVNEKPRWIGFLQFEKGSINLNI